MTLDEYQKRAMSTCLKSCKNFAYMSFGLLAEAGEVADKVAKAVRKDEAGIYANGLTSSRVFPGQKDLDRVDKTYDKIVGEIGDVLWFCAGLADACGVSLEDVANRNLCKLADRKKKDTIITHTDH